ncbi:methyltransferase domain-containing protein [Chryseolinea sp. H1M3-3]|uniref:methyltransferase domain-containing protein n=1 Tax=Chryseolinea sp. H1M3-3 TaxID=3034144 RepID=UPI0023ECA3F5|nr:methyltransferase domain-containing protein [Chryseolinea sp. H1M3-3]
MPDLTKRSSELEIMDDLTCEGETLNQTLRELEFINKWLGGNQITINAISELLESHPRDARPITIVDLGCGGGEMLRVIDTWAKKNSRRFNLIGVDANPYIIGFAKKNLKDLSHLQFVAMDIFSEEFSNQRYDIVIGTLFYHHFSDAQLIGFFKQLRNQVNLGFIINDIHRHWLAYHSIKMLTHFFSKSSMVKYDAPLSVRRAFKKDDLIKILSEAKIDEFKINWRWAFRWQVIAKISG